MSPLPHLHYVPALSIPSAPRSRGAEGCIPLGLEEYKHIWKEAAAEETICPPECGQDGMPINNLKSVRRSSLLGLPLQRLTVIDEATGTCQAFCS